jgi:hypothetical protein
MVKAKCTECKVKPTMNPTNKLCMSCYHKAYAKTNSERIKKYQIEYRQKMSQAALLLNGPKEVKETVAERELRSVESLIHSRVKLNYKSSDILNANEIEFVENFFQHTDWVHHPCSFRLSNMSYTPDFYDKRRNVFIEVSGTRQAYHQNKLKYQLLTQEFPAINFEIRKVNGLLLRTDRKQISWFKYFTQK